MGEVKKRSKQVKKAVSSGVKKVTSAPKKVGQAIEKGAKKVGTVIGDAPSALVDATVTKPLNSLGQGAGNILSSVGGGLGEGLGGIARNLVDPARDFLGFNERKADFDRLPDVILPSAQPSGQTFVDNSDNKLPMFIAIGAGILVLFFVIKKKGKK